MPTSGTENDVTAGHDTAPVDVETISEITGRVLGLCLTTATREDILAHAAAVHGFLDLLVREDLGAGHDPAVRNLIGKAYVLLAAKAPTRETPCFRAYAHVREAADITRRLLRVWAGRNREAGRHGRDAVRVTGERP
ncbi:hypothetical protein [Streptomyces sp. NPDC060184]|uniref:hypothetical protein n=1 Tax=Streptomyces sp. NPDC060184 TaxID=3347064 RepID=UPI00365683AC